MNAKFVLIDISHERFLKNFYHFILANMVEFSTTIGEFPINTSSSEI